MLTVKKVGRGGVARETGIEKGDVIEAFDGHSAVDILDYLYYDSSEHFTMTVSRGDETVVMDIEKDENESLDLEFESDGLEIRECRNKCVFCFVDQMPKGLRPSLYVKDDDYRQSFLCGNYVTLTNLSDEDVERIIRLHLSPLYISVHTTDGELRKKMLNNRFADRINYYLDRFGEAGIIMHTQIVLVRGMNDGAALEKTCFDLASRPMVSSVSVVPCGVTAFREGLFHIDDIDGEFAAETISAIDSINVRLRRPAILAADEFYLRAGKECRPAEDYGDYCQKENGVGMLREFETSFDAFARKRRYRRTYLIVTGVSAKPFMEKMAAKTEALCRGVKIHVVAARNEFFGDTVTCAGLIVGADLLKAAKSFEGEYDELAISYAMLKEDEDVFLDGMTLEELSSSLGKPVRVTRGSGGAFYDSLTRDIKPMKGKQK